MRLSSLFHIMILDTLTCRTFAHGIFEQNCWVGYHLTSHIVRVRLTKSMVMKRFLINVKLLLPRIHPTKNAGLVAFSLLLRLFLSLGSNWVSAYKRIIYQLSHKKLITVGSIPIPFDLSHSAPLRDFVWLLYSPLRDFHQTQYPSSIFIRSSHLDPFISLPSNHITSRSPNQSHSAVDEFWRLGAANIGPSAKHQDDLVWNRPFGPPCSQGTLESLLQHRFNIIRRTLSFFTDPSPCTILLEKP